MAGGFVPIPITKVISMRPLLTCLLFPALLASTAALADGAVPVTLPPLPRMGEPEFVALLDRLVVANVISSNCQGFAITDGEWGLLTGTADLIAAELGLDAAAYDAAFYGPAFDLLDDPASCAARGPDVRPVIDLLIEMGGSPVANG
jgi:hypothetical protein